MRSVPHARSSYFPRQLLTSLQEVRESLLADEANAEQPPVDGEGSDASSEDSTMGR